MTHLSAHWQYVAISYALTLGCSAFLAIGAARRLGRARATYEKFAPQPTSRPDRAS